MVARRNRCFAVAAMLAALSWIVLSVGAAIDLNRLLHETTLGGYNASDGIWILAHLVGAAGLMVVATAFGEGVDWRRLRLGGTIVATSQFAFVVGSVFRLIAVFAEVDDTKYRLSSVVSAVAALFVAAAVSVAVSGWTDANRGRARSDRLWLAGGLIVVSSLGTTISQLLLQAYWSSFPRAPSELTMGTTIIAIGGFVTAIGALAFARGARRPLAAREMSLARAAGLAIVGGLLFAGGEALVAIAFDVPGYSGAYTTYLWLGVANRIVFVAAIAFVALGARRAGRDLGGFGAAEEEAALAGVVGEGGGAAELG